MAHTPAAANDGSAGADTPTLRRSHACPQERTNSMAKVTQAKERGHHPARRSRPVPSTVPPRLMDEAVRVFLALGITAADLRLRAKPGSVLIDLADAMDSPGRCVMMGASTQQAAPMARSLADICQAVRQANCGECWQVPGKPCTRNPEGDHVARFGRAARRGLITGPELVSVLGAFDVFTTATIVRTPGGA